MHIELRRLSVDDGMDIYQMLRQIPDGENGFTNGCYGAPYEKYRAWLKRSDDISKGIGLEDWMVPGNIYWLFIDGRPVGMGKLRHYLTDKLLTSGGHVGYAIAPAHRGKGYGTLLLRLLIEEAKKLNIDRLLLTVQNHNTASVKVALANGGVIEKTDEERHHIWIAVGGE